MSLFLTLIYAFVGALLGQMLFIVVASIIKQRSRKYQENFREAFLIYVKKDTGPIVMGVIVILIAIFLLPEVIANVSTLGLDGAAEQTKYQKILSSIVKWVRSWSVLLGIGSHTIGFLAVSQANKFFKRVGGDVDDEFIKKENK